MRGLVGFLYADVAERREIVTAGDVVAVYIHGGVGPQAAIASNAARTIARITMALVGNGLIRSRVMSASLAGPSHNRNGLLLQWRFSRAMRQEVSPQPGGPRLPVRCGQVGVMVESASGSDNLHSCPPETPALQRAKRILGIAAVTFATIVFDPASSPPALRR